MSMILTVRYGIFPRPDNLDGTNLTVDASSGVNGETEQRSVAPGDAVACVAVNEQTGTVDVKVYEVVDGAAWPLAEKQPEPGDLVVVVGADAPIHQRGSIAAFLEDGSIMGSVSVGMLSHAVESGQLHPGGGTITITGSYQM